jgi:hypothetical protein
MKKILFMLALIPTVCCGQSFRFTNQYGGTTGYAQPNMMGGYRFTNQYGGTTGYAQPDMMGGYRFTNPYGGTVGYFHRGW